MSLASANGPSVTVFGLPLTSFPELSSGWPGSLIWPLSVSSFSHPIHFCICCCACSGDPGIRSPPRYKYTNSLMISSCVVPPSTLMTCEGRGAGHLFVRGGLNAVELGILAALCHQLVMCPDLDDACAVEHHNQIRHPHRRETV